MAFIEFELAIERRPSSLKTVGIELFRNWHHVFYTDSFSAKSMVSHSDAIKKKISKNRHVT